MTWRQALKKIKSHPDYGLKVAKEYFTEIGRGKVWRRSIEIISGSNSVFQEKPYQKNIQTGTYRIWKNISESEADFFAPFLGEKSRAQAIPIFEG